MKHYGFSQIPRIVIRGEKYKDLSLLELGLYTGLKDICGETGECFYILRNLAEILHTSISTLSRYIPKLKERELITAEKKVRGSGGNKHEIWHIRIVNIWEENDALYAPADCFTEKQSLEEIVSDRNKDDAYMNSVSQRNTVVSDRNKDCFSLNDRRRISNKNNLTKEESITEVSANGNITNPEIEDGTHVPLTPSPSFSLEVPRLTLPQRDMKQARMDEAEQGMIHMLLDPAIKADVFYLRDQKYTVSYFQDEGETFFLIKDPDTGKREPYNHSEFLHLVAKVRQDSAELSKRGIAHEVQNVLNEVFGEEKRFPSPPPLTPAIETTPLQPENSPLVDEPVNHTAESGNASVSASPSQIEAFSEEEVSGGQTAALSSKQASAVSHSQGATGNDAPAETPEPEKTNKGKGRGRTTRPRAKKPTSFVVPEELAPRVEKVKEFLNAWRRKKLDDPEECFIFDDDALKAICELFQGKPPTDKKLEQICERIWSEPRNTRTGYYPREHMTVQAICKQYKGQSMVLAASTVKRAAQSGASNHFIDDDEQEVVVGIAQLRRLQGRV